MQKQGQINKFLNLIRNLNKTSFKSKFTLTQIYKQSKNNQKNQIKLIQPPIVRFKSLGHDNHFLQTQSNFVTFRQTKPTYLLRNKTTKQQSENNQQHTQRKKNFYDQYRQQIQRKNKLRNENRIKKINSVDKQVYKNQFHPTSIKKSFQMFFQKHNLEDKYLPIKSKQPSHQLICINANKKQLASFFISKEQKNHNKSLPNTEINVKKNLLLNKTYLQIKKHVRLEKINRIKKYGNKNKTQQQYQFEQRHVDKLQGWIQQYPQQLEQINSQNNVFF